VVAINDVTSAGALAHLLDWHTIHGRFSGRVESDAAGLGLWKDEDHVHADGVEKNVVAAAVFAKQEHTEHA